MSNSKLLTPLQIAYRLLTLLHKDIENNTTLWCFFLPKDY